MNVHPGDLIRWHGEEHHVVLVRNSYLTLRPSDGDDDIEVLAADLQAEAEPASARSTSEVLDLRVLDDLDRADRKIVNVWIDELDRLDQLIADGASTSAATRLIVNNVNRRLGTEYSPRKVQRQHQALQEIGVSGLLDRRRFGLAEAPARSYDSRLVEAFTDVIDDQTNKATGTKTRVMWLALQQLEQRHGTGVVPVPSRATLYRLIDLIDSGRHTFGSARTRRTTANQPKHMHGKRVGLRPRGTGAHRYDTDGDSCRVRR